MRVFVTGATGFVGSAIVQELIQGAIRCLDWLARTRQPSRSSPLAPKYTGRT